VRSWLFPVRLPATGARLFGLDLSSVPNRTEPWSEPPQESSRPQLVGRGGLDSSGVPNRTEPASNAPRFISKRHGLKHPQDYRRVLRPTPPCAGFASTADVHGGLAQSKDSSKQLPTTVSPLCLPPPGDAGVATASPAPTFSPGQPHYGTDGAGGLDVAEKPVDRSAGRATLRPTQPIASRTRDELGAGVKTRCRWSEIWRDQGYTKRLYAYTRRFGSGLLKTTQCHWCRLRYDQRYAECPYTDPRHSGGLCFNKCPLRSMAPLRVLVIRALPAIRSQFVHNSPALTEAIPCQRQSPPIRPKLRLRRGTALAPSFQGAVARLLSCPKPRRLPNKLTGTDDRPIYSIHPQEP